MKDEFDILAAKALSGEASAEEGARLEALLAESAERRQIFTGLKAVWAALKATAPIGQALAARPAPIPGQRLRQLQQAVREQARGTNMVTLPQRQGLAPVTNDASASAFGAFWRWLQNRMGVPRVSVTSAILALVVIVGIVFLFRQPDDNSSHGTASSTPVGYLIAQEGSIELLRAGKLVSVGSAVGIHRSDEIRLAPGARGTLLTRTGIVTLAGSRRSAVSSLVPTDDHSGDDASSRRLNSALFRPAAELLAAGLLVSNRGSGSIPLYSPVGATASLTPLILWKSEPGKTYDLVIIDEFNPSTPTWRLTGVAPPVEFSKVEAWTGRSLTNNGLYRLRLSETGRPLTASEFTFRTAEDAAGVPRDNANNPFLEALQILNVAPGRVGDALALLHRLPPDQADTELAMRLKLLIFGQLGYQADFEITLARLRAIR